MTTQRAVGCLGAAAIALAAACGGEEVNGGAAIAISDPPGAAAVGRLEPGAPERSAPIPESACDWFPASEVEALVGKLNGPPREQEGGCFYPLPVDSITIARRAKADQVRAARARGGM